MAPTCIMPHGTYITYVTHRFKHRPRGICLDLGAKWHMFKPRLGLDLSHMASIKNTILFLGLIKVEPFLLVHPKMQSF